MAEFFDSWRPTKGEAVVERDWKRFCPFSPQSSPLVLPSATDASEQVVLPLFGAVSASTSGSGLTAGALAANGGPITSSAAGSSNSLSKSEARDVVFNAGGPVWALDWCPPVVTSSLPGSVASADGGYSRGATAAAAAGSSGGDYLAVSCHPLGAQRNVIGTLLQSPACIQVWKLSHPEQQQQQQQQQLQQQHSQQQPGLQLPSMVLALAHDGGLAWHCQWCPDPGLAESLAAAGNRDMLPRLGLLAAALGDGSMRVWAVPLPEAAHRMQQQTSAGDDPAAPVVLSLPPVAVVHSTALGGSLPCIVDWLPAPPYDLLAVGCWDGSVAIFKLSPSQAGPLRPPQKPAANGSSCGLPGSGCASSSSSMVGLKLVSHFTADVLPLRALRWVPPSACEGSIDKLHRHAILTGGHEGCLRLWDLRDPFQPLYSHILSSNSTILSADWTARPFGVLVAMEDASLRGLVLDSNIINRSVEQEKKAMFSVSWRGLNMGALWSVAVHPSMQLVGYGGEEGEVGVFQVEYEANSRRRMPHTAVAALRAEGGVLVLRGRRELELEHGLFSGRVIERMPNLKGARLPDEQEAVQRVAWSRHDGSAGAWLASGGAAGLVRCQLIQSK